jgi:hypothetical protein
VFRRTPKSKSLTLDDQLQRMQRDWDRRARENARHFVDTSCTDWTDFQNDPEWKKVAAESEANGKLVLKVERVWLDPTEFSALK